MEVETEFVELDLGGKGEAEVCAGGDVVKRVVDAVVCGFENDVCSAVGEVKRAVRWEMNEPILVPQEPSVAFTSVAGVGDTTCCCVFAALVVDGAPTLPKDKGFNPLGGVAVFPDASSTSLLDTSTGALDNELVDALASACKFVLLGDFCTHRSLIPSTARKKLVEPEAIVRETASRAGASCWSR